MKVQGNKTSLKSFDFGSYWIQFCLNVWNKGVICVVPRNWRHRPYQNKIGGDVGGVWRKKWIMENVNNMFLKLLIIP